MLGQTYVRCLLVASTLLLAPAWAQAASFNVSGGLGQAEICTDSGCTNPVYSLDTSGSATGTVQIDDVTGNFTFDIQVGTTSLAGGSGALLQSLRFVGQGTSDFPGATFTFDLDGTVDVTGSVEINSVSDALSGLGADITGGSCIDNLTGGWTCGIGVPSPGVSVSLGGTPHYVLQTLNVVLTPAPEPAIGLLLLLPLGLIARRR